MADSDTDKELSSFPPKKYTVGWICALWSELQAARAILDEEHAKLQNQPKHDGNNYVLGHIGPHNIVMAVLPRYGTNRAAVVASKMQSTFPGLRFVLMVGIGGGVHSEENDIRLGDIVVSFPDDLGGGVIQYDLGREETNEFRRVGLLNEPPSVLTTAVVNLRSEFGLGRKISKLVQKTISKTAGSSKTWTYPGTDQDMLFKSSCVHVEGNRNCNECVEKAEPKDKVQFDDREDTYPRIFYGNIGSGNSVMKSAVKRDLIAKKENVICFEMEAAGLMNDFPCLVIRGISDYADSHKNWKWQSYAAVVAAAYARKLLLVVAPQAVEDLACIKTSNDILVLEIVSRTEANVEMMKSQLDTKEDVEILDWFTPIDYGLQQSDFIHRRHAGTGQWFLDSAEFQAWLKTDKQTLFCPGIPGAGKTIITAIVIDYLYWRFRDDQNTGIAYIYCNFRRQDEQKAEDLLASLLKQLARSRPASVKDLYDRCQETRTRPKFDEICQTLRSVAATYSRVFIVVDALDEYQISDDSRTRFLKEIFELQIHAVANIFATSRPSREISNSFSKGLSRTIRPTDGDILTYLNNKMSLRQSDIIDDEMRGMIRRGVLEAADGMFLLVQLHTDTLLSKLTKGDLKLALQALGKGMAGLDDTYDQAMKRIKDQGQERQNLAKQILTWIVHSKRPLATLELQHALAVRKNTTALDTDFLPNTKLILSVCAGLVTVDEESSIIRLVHYTTQEYFVRTRKKWFREAEYDITTTCVTYLSFDSFKSGSCLTDAELEQRLRSSPLYNYAARSWGHHAHEALSGLVISFLESTAKVEASSQAMLAIKQYSSHSNYSQRVPRNMTGLHLAAYFGLDEVGSALLNRGQSPDQRDSYRRTPLSYSAERGHEAVVKLLLVKEGVGVDTKDENGRTPLSWAVKNRHKAIVELLLSKGADVDAKDKDGRTPLSWAADNGYEAIVKVLLSKGAVVDTKDKDGRTPLLWAVKNGHEAVVELLLANGADVGAKDRLGWRPLSRAAANGHEA
ncbi:hypothetical protein B0J15DRAFT_451759, partial [Fusarium solani]